MTNAGGCAVPRRASLSGWLARPLCRRYVLATFDVAIVRCRNADGLRPHCVHWAFGWLADGECEPLGAWIDSGTGADSAFTMLANLTSRGVERIWHVTGTEAGPVQEHLAAAFSSTTARASVDRRLMESLAASVRCGVPSPEVAAKQVSEGLIRAFRRHGSFESEAAVLDFAAGALQRTERRLDRGGVIATMSPRQRAGTHGVPLGI